jgi:hypothetical protein
LEILERACAGESRESDLQVMAGIGANMRAGSLCGHGQLGYNPVDSALKSFADEFRAQMYAEGPIPIGKFVGPLITRRGAHLHGETPSAIVDPQFVARIEPVVNGGARARSQSESISGPVGDTGNPRKARSDRSGEGR